MSSWVDDRQYFSTYKSLGISLEEKVLVYIINPVLLLVFTYKSSLFYGANH